MVGQDAENMLAGLLAGREIAPLAEAQHHIEKTEMRPPVGDGVMLATDRANPNAAEWKNPGLHRGLADDFHDLAHIDECIEIGGIFKGEMRHVRTTPNSSGKRRAR